MSRPPRPSGCRAACGGGASPAWPRPFLFLQERRVLDWSWSGSVGVTPVWSLESCVGGVAGLRPRLPPHYFLPRLLPPAALPAAQVLDLPGDPQEVAPAWAHSGLRGLVCIWVRIKFICLFSLLAVLGLRLRCAAFSGCAHSRRHSDCRAQALVMVASLKWGTGSGSVSSAVAACGL